MTDIVICTRDRLELLKRTLGHIKSRTSARHAILAIDDGSTDGTVDYLRKEDVVLAPHDRPLGIAGNIRHVKSMAKVLTDPFVFTDDDALCPDVIPDWLTRLLRAQRDHPDVGILALNNPQCHPLVRGDSRRREVHEDEITICRNVGGQFALIKRDVIQAIEVPDGLQSPFKHLCIEARKLGWRVGYLTHTYCQHIGTVSVRMGNDMSADLAMVAPVDPLTLAPPARFVE